MKSFLILFLICNLIHTSSLQAQIPQTLSYQGILLNNNGQLVSNGDYLITFKVYDDLLGDTAIWEETQNLSVTDGIINAILGSVSPLNLSFDDPYWLGITISNESEMKPRIELTSASYSLNSKQVKGETNFFPGNGNTGIGTTDPHEKLEVNGTILSTNGGFKFPDGSIQTTAALNSGLGDNLGNHTATQDINMNGYNLTNGNILNEVDLNVKSGSSMSFESGNNLNLVGGSYIVLLSGNTLDMQSQNNMQLISGQDLNIQSQYFLGLTSGKDFNIQSQGNAGLASSKDLNIQSNLNTGISAGNKITLEAVDEISIKCGNASITLLKNGDITIKGTNILIEGSSNVVIKSPNLPGNKIQ